MSCGLYSLLFKIQTESEVEVDKDFLKSGVHHVVDEPGAYVPNSVSFFLYKVIWLHS